MKKSLIAYPFLAFIFFVVVNAGTAFASSNHSSVSSAYTQVRACGQTAPGFAHCLVIVLKPTGIHPHALTATPAGFTPNDLQNAYKLPSATAGKGQTIAIVDAYDNPNAEADLAVYRSAFGLPACTTANLCFRKVNQRGQATAYPSPNDSWGEEIALDVEMVSATCQSCKILLVEADSNSFNNLAAAVD